MQHEIVLVFGMRRSGTTWLAKVLDSHLDTVYRHEPNSWIALDNIDYFPDLEHCNTGSEYLEVFFNKSHELSIPHVVAKIPLFLKSYLSKVAYARQRFQASLSKVVGRYSALSINACNVLPKLDQSQYRLVWKSVESPTRIGYISSALPDSRTIFLLRHPCGYLNSYIRGQDAGRMPRTTDTDFDVNMWRKRLTCSQSKKYGVTLDRVRGWNRKERVVWEWIIDNEKAMDDLSGRENAKLVIYDELCNNLSKGFEDIFRHVGLALTQSTLRLLEDGKKIQKRPILVCIELQWWSRMPGKRHCQHVIRKWLRDLQEIRHRVPISTNDRYDRIFDY